MKKATKLPYEEARLDVTFISIIDVISTSGADNNFDDGGWTH